MTWEGLKRNQEIRDLHFSNLEKESQQLAELASNHCKFRKDLPKLHQGELMQLERTPIGVDFFETEKILQTIFGNEYFPGWQSELQWALHPPVGPLPRASWPRPPYKLDDGIRTTTYIISFKVPLSDGTHCQIFKPGLTRGPVITSDGQRGRYSRRFGPDVIFEACNIDTRIAWMCEQKLLQCMPLLPWSHSFDDWVWYWNTYEDHMRATDGDYLKVRSLIQSERDSKRKKPVVLYDQILKSKSDRLGETEWRDWCGTTAALRETVERIVGLTKATPL